MIRSGNGNQFARGSDALRGLIDAWGQQIGQGGQAGKPRPSLAALAKNLRSATAEVKQAGLRVSELTKVCAAGKAAVAEATAAHRDAKATATLAAKAVASATQMLASAKAAAAKALPSEAKAAKMEVGAAAVAVKSAQGRLAAAQQIVKDTAGALEAKTQVYKQNQGKLTEAKTQQQSALDRQREARRAHDAAQEKQRAEEAQQQATQARKQAEADQANWDANRRYIAELDARAAEAKRRIEAAHARAAQTELSIESLHTHFDTEGSEIDSVHATFAAAKHFANVKQNAVQERALRERAQIAADEAFAQSLAGMIRSLVAQAGDADVSTITIPTCARVASSVIQGPPLAAALELLAGAIAESTASTEAELPAQSRRSAIWALGKGLMPHPGDLATLLNKAGTHSATAREFEAVAKDLDALDGKRSSIPRLQGFVAKDRLQVLDRYREQLGAFGPASLIDLLCRPEALAEGAPAKRSPLTDTVWQGLSGLADKHYGDVDTASVDAGVKLLLRTVPSRPAAPSAVPPPDPAHMSPDDLNQMLDGLFG